MLAGECLTVSACMKTGPILNGIMIILFKKSLSDVLWGWRALGVGYYRGFIDHIVNMISVGLHTIPLHSLFLQFLFLVSFLYCLFPFSF